jgi:hypothetical protein
VVVSNDMSVLFLASEMLTVSLVILARCVIVGCEYLCMYCPVLASQSSSTFSRMYDKVPPRKIAWPIATCLAFP